MDITASQEIPTSLRTSRLLLRAFQPGDGAWYYQAGLRNRDHLARYETDNFVRTFEDEAQAEKTVCGLADQFAARRSFFMAAFDGQTGEFVAQVYIGVANLLLPEFEVGYWADTGHQGQGYVTEAVQGALGFIFNHLHAHRVRLECDDTNTRSSRVAERCGLRREAHFLENKRQPDGCITGTLVYGLLRSEYEARAA